MAEFVVSSDGFESMTMKTGTAYAAAHRYGVKVLCEDATDDDEFDVNVFCPETGKTHVYMVRAQVTMDWVVTRKKENEEDAE